MTYDQVPGASLIDAAAARDYVLSHVHPLAPRLLTLDDALGCVSADVLRALEPSPRFDNSSMDGFALRAKDTVGGQRRLRVIGSVFAGDAGDLPVREGEAARIMTGAPIPEGADSVCMRELATLEANGESVLIHREARAGEFVRRVGDDVHTGQTLFESGREIGPAMLGVLASQGVRSLLAHPRPRVGVLSTGNELAGPDDTLTPGAIRDANRPALLASLRQSNVTAIDLGVVGDHAEEISRALQQGLANCDAIISTGGVSVGDADFVKGVIGELAGASARSMQVAIKPGKPFAFGVTDAGVPLFGLAGNPVSTLVGFELFVRPALRLLAGHDNLDRPTIAAVLDGPLERTRDGKLHLVHVVVRLRDDGRLHVEQVARQASHLLHAVAECNAVALVPDGDGLTAHDEVNVLLLEPSQLRGA